MCGIAGFFTVSSNYSRADLHDFGRRMTDAIIHRGPDSSGLWQDPDCQLLLGHRRLSIIDLSEEGHQPMESPSARYIVTYNGEIYNFLKLREDLEQNGISFRGRSDTEVMMAAFDQWGINQTLQKLQGMFAIALWDRKERILHFMRDRMGKKPLYIGWAGQSLIFGSELRALKAHPDFTAKIDPAALSQYMRFGYVNSPHSIYENVWSLPAGFRLSLPVETLEAGSNITQNMQSYWHHLRVLQTARTAQHKGDDQQTVDEFEALLTSCVKDRMISDVPLGAFLSGGIDSSTIVALMQEQTTAPVKTYSIGFEEEAYNEAGYARKIADHLGTDHHELILSGSDALAHITKLPSIYDEPFADISALPTSLVCEFARRDVTVTLSGDGGDEMLGGYNRHLIAPKIYNRMRFMPGPLRKALARGMCALSTQRWDALIAGKPGIGSHMHKLASILSLNTQEEIYKRLLSQSTDDLTLSNTQADLMMDRPEWQPAANDRLSFAEKMMYWDALIYLPEGILTKVDRASMAVSLEARAPLLDQRIYEYVWSLPAHYKIRGGTGKWLLREVLQRHVPRTMFERPKQGFSIPVGEWLKGPLKDWAANLLDETRMKNDGYLNPIKTTHLWKAHLNGQGNHANALWSVLMFQAWLRNSQAQK